MTAATDLAQKMFALCERDNLPPDHALRVRAEEFDEATKGYVAVPQTVPVAKFMGAWARARRAWCAYTGEPLV
jgi:hypothetical protein